jgi:hypothetical protein
MMKQSIDKWKEELIAAGWSPAFGSLWKSPSGALFHGPYHAWQMMQQYPALNTRKERKQISFCPTQDMPLA